MQCCVCLIHTARQLWHHEPNRRTVVNTAVQLVLPVDGGVTCREPRATLQLLGVRCIQTSSTLLYSGSKSHKSRCKRTLKPVSSVLPPAHTFTYVVCVVQSKTKLHSNFSLTQLLYSVKSLHILYTDYMFELIRTSSRYLPVTWHY
jgi:hypothetical protein